MGFRSVPWAEGADILEVARLKARICIGKSLSPSEDAMVLRILQDRQIIAKKSGLKAAKAMTDMAGLSAAIDSAQMREHFVDLVCHGCGNVTREKICEYYGRIK